MNLIDELATKIEAYPNKLITKTYVLKLLRESQRHECEHCTQIPVYEMTSLRSGLQAVSKGGD